MKYFPKIVGEKVYLSPLNLEDCELFTKWMNDPNITNNTGGSVAITSLLSERRWIENSATASSNFTGNDVYIFSIIKKENDEAIGNINLININQIHRIANVGIMIGEHDEHNKGYGTDAMKCMLGYAFNTLNFQNIMLNVYDFNERAQKCYEKC
jgi:RimJ/RimL family protein N-acetyltransferase